MILNAIKTLASSLGVEHQWTEVFGPLMTTSIENSIKTSAGRAMTGPIVRRDLETIDLHVASLAMHAPRLLPLYMVGGTEIARILREQGILSPDDQNMITRHFKSLIPSIPASNHKRSRT